MRVSKQSFSLLTSLGLVTVALTGCGQGSTSASSSSGSSSASEMAASSVGGALASSDSSGTMAFSEFQRKNIWSVLLLPSAQATNACPTVASGGTGCAASGNPVLLTYSSCSFGSSAATWSGTLEVSLINNGAITCGTFPDHAGSRLANNDGILRQFVDGSGNPSTAVRTNAAGVPVIIDHASANLANFDTGTSINPNIGTGYGTKVVFNGSGGRKEVQVRQRLYSAAFDHSIDADVTLSEAAGTRTITGGTVKVYHNKLKVIGTSTFTNVTYNNQCCNPISGSISTAFSQGANVSPTALGALVVGQSETLTFTGCGTATLTNTSGTTTNVTLNNCF
ncbi:MAG TPA: hypothetical protein VN132_09375 [Bdellovibrio sp.]|nr:hypothetical protein [Bdellovibrio sp.]